MTPIARNIVAVVGGLVIGGLVNMGLIKIGGYLVPPPAGVVVTSIDDLKNSMHLFEARHFVFPFLAHALGTLVGAFIAAAFAASHRARLALLIGFLFLAGGVANVYMLPSPPWFDALDLLAAYLPMAWLGGNLAASRK